MKKFSMAGTLGDAFIVYCKLYDYWKRTGERIGLYRYSSHVDFDKPIQEFFANTPFIEYLSPCIYRRGGIRKGDKIKAPYINVFWHGKGQGNCYDDPDYIKMAFYPEVFIDKDPTVDTSKFNVGIQLHCGKPWSNYKGFALSWLKKIIKEFSEFGDVVFWLFGTGEKHRKKTIEQFCQKHQVKNFVGKTSLKEWMSKIMAMNFMLTPLGFDAYFAMSQKITCLVIYDYNSRLCRIPPQWGERNICIWPGPLSVFKKLKRKYLGYCYIKPLHPSQIKSIIDLHHEYFKSRQLH